MVMVDDDNVLAPDYLEQVLRLSSLYPFLGSWSGQIELEFEDSANPPPQRLRHLLCERVVEKAIWSNDRNHIAATPWGAGMCIRREVALAYARATSIDPRRLRLDLQGNELAYGGDTDLAYLGCAMNLGMGVFPSLKCIHLIPRERCTLKYLLKNLQAHAYSEIFHQWLLTGSVSSDAADLQSYLRGCLRWLAADSLGRKMIQATRRGYSRARAELEQTSSTFK
jgi:hypothetical protein